MSSRVDSSKEYRFFAGLESIRIQKVGLVDGSSSQILQYDARTRIRLAGACCDGGVLAVTFCSGRSLIETCPQLRCRLVRHLSVSHGLPWLLGDPPLRLSTGAGICEAVFTHNAVSI